jgi:hypothetical protein
MSAKHRPPHPKRRRSVDDLERRVRRLERSVKADMVSIARSQSEKALRDHNRDKHAELHIVWQRDEIGSTSA